MRLASRRSQEDNANCRGWALALTTWTLRQSSHSSLQQDTATATTLQPLKEASQLHLLDSRPSETVRYKYEQSYHPHSPIAQQWTANTPMKVKARHSTTVMKTGTEARWRRHRCPPQSLIITTHLSFQCECFCQQSIKSKLFVPQMIWK
jgi:hypothetical protein